MLVCEMPTTSFWNGRNDKAIIIFRSSNNKKKKLWHRAKARENFAEKLRKEMKKREATEEAQANTIGKIINNNNRAKTVC